MDKLPVRICDKECKYYLQEESNREGICTYDSTKTVEGSKCNNRFVTNETLRKLTSPEMRLFADTYSSGQVTPITREEAIGEFGL